MTLLPRRLSALLPSVSARLHLAFGLASLLTTVLLVALFAGFVPDRRSAIQDGRFALAEALASSGSMLLRRGDVDGVRRTLEFMLERRPELQRIELHRYWNDSVIGFGAPGAIERGDEDGAAPNTIVVPLIRAGKEWGDLRFRFADANQGVWWKEWRASPFGLMGFVGLLGFCLFYLYLGKMLKQLDPSAAVPGRVRSALDSIAECLLVIDRAGDIALANAAFCELTGRAADSLVGMPISSLQWGEEDKDHQRPWQTALDTGQPVLQAAAVYPGTDGTRRKFLVNCSPVQGAEGTIGGVLISMDDITQLEEQERQLRAAMLNAEQANQAKSAFLSNMSHEIRTPMTAILGFTDVLRRQKGCSDADRQRYLSTIASSGGHLLELINDVLDLSKVESGAMTVELIAADPVRLLSDVKETLAVKAVEKSIALELDVTSPVPSSILSDPSRLRQIVTNLVGNAIKFTQEGGVRIGLSCDAEGERLLIEVRDSGIGMNEAQQTSIFEAFTQADESITRRFGGTGLGLSISRKLCEVLGGGISVTSVPGEGSTFLVSIPTGPLDQAQWLSPADAMLAAAWVDTVTVTAWRFPAARVLVADDAAENRELLSLLLGELGLSVTLAENGAEAVAAVRDAPPEKPIDAVLMDIQMPVMDGYQAVAALRADGWARPVIALTANAMKGYERELLDAGFSHYQSKPVDIDALSALLAQLLGGEPLVQDDRTPVALVVPADATGAEPIAGPATLRSALDTSDPRFAAIVASFATKLGDRMTVAERALADQDWTALASFGHWLKGSAGTVGLPALGEPAARLEQAALDQQPVTSRTCLVELRALEGCIEPADASGNRMPGEPAARNVTQPPVALSNEAERPDTFVRSTLWESDARFRPIVERFLVRLDDQLVLMRTALETDDSEALAGLAHWLKGSGGNVGFDGFTEPASVLEQAAKDGRTDDMTLALERIERFARRLDRGTDHGRQAA